MAREVKQLIAPQQVPVSAAPLYIVPTNRSTTITRITFTNTTSTDYFVSLWFVANGDSPTDSNNIINEDFVAAGEAFSPSVVEGHTLPSGTSIQVAAEAATSITIVASGTEITN